MTGIANENTDTVEERDNYHNIKKKGEQLTQKEAEMEGQGTDIF